MKQIFRAGFPRSGSQSMAILYRRLGVYSIHIVNEHANRPVKNERFIHYYNIEKPPRTIIDFAVHKKKTTPKNQNYFEADPYTGMGIYQLSKVMPWVEIMVVVRNPIEVCNSFRNYRALNPRLCRPKDVNWYLEKWIIYHYMVLRQIEKMEKKPFVFLFKDYVTGSLNEILLEVFPGLNNPINRSIIKNHILRKINHKGKYEMIEPESSLKRTSLKLYKIFVENKTNK